MGLLQPKIESPNTRIVVSNENIADKLCSSYMDFSNPKHVIIDDILYSSLIVINYSHEMEPLFLDRILSLDINANLTMYYIKQNTYDVIKELTYTIGNVGANIKTSNENEQGIEVVGTTYSDARFIRKQLQMGDEDFFYICILIGVYAKNEEQLETDLEKLESICISCGLNTIRANFRQEEAFKMIIPFNKEEETISGISRRNVLTTGLSATYPFVSNELFDKNGILIGVNAFDKSILMLDRFNSVKYKNSNMFVVGTSGSGKSYFVKLMINRNRFLNISQFIIDPDREYKKLCKSLDGAYINFGLNQTINVFDIREYVPDEGESLLLNKVSKLKIFFSMIFENMSKEEESLLEEQIIKCYEKYSIYENNDSLYISNPKSKIMGKKIFRTYDMMPTLEDLNDLLKRDKKLKKYSLELKPYISGTMKFLNSKTSIDTNNKLVVVDIHDIGEKDIPIVMYVVTEYFWDLIKKDRRSKKILYLDEVWKLINKNPYTADFVFKLFKTVRKYGGGATAITQDISDFFMLEEGKYGKGILNNSSIKCMFQLEETDINMLEKVIGISEEEKYRLLNMKRGTAIIHADRNALMVDIVSTPNEHDRITTDREDLEKQMEVFK